MSESLQPPSATQICSELQDLILRDLLGPAGGPEEIIDEPYFRDRFILSILALYTRL